MRRCVLRHIDMDGQVVLELIVAYKSVPKQSCMDFKEQKMCVYEDFIMTKFTKT